MICLFIVIKFRMAKIIGFHQPIFAFHGQEMSTQQNIPILQKYKDNIENLTIDNFLEIIANKNGTKKSYSTKK